MRHSVVFFVLVHTLLAASGQRGLHPIAWQYSARKVADKTYEVHLTAQLQTGWHAYSQKQPEDAVAQPTEIRFKPNPLVGLMGKIREIGAMEKWKDEASGIQANQYANQVDFVQVVKVKGNVRTSVSGSLTYQVCTNEMCLPPKTDNFVVQLGE
ncbi:protein-disulfide reductase DsbD family protein [Flavitalea sp. BT771]|uniref:protein-disulfide reductase DsbD domain-containing protein n=1 Tax=Flavitalea sp. BT771 TaxID=3063329 RepID=UPI0026E2096F|nr:protein-disulfide reductase DsbD domain-containing protein [Flavitalea sp. BT771]MDO6434546.1 protein-disulfide reductase DsbD family protein [Flavitalea sp. BT771]MDV6223446.1 protein-disulfide reductase DsbD family protein [Flavitalea sp. BT771]